MKNGNLKDLLTEVKKTGNKIYIIDVNAVDDVENNLQYSDIENKQYAYDRSKFNKFTENDLVIFRKTQSKSESKEFYLYGYAIIDKIEDITKTDEIKANKPVIAKLRDAHILEKKIMQNDLIKINWSKKGIVSDFKHFFWQYGVTEIMSDDLENILKL